ncbi:hypothetical protein IJD44_02485 [bacterium]|nr:hypothetical protein [bacterium]
MNFQEQTEKAPLEIKGLGETVLETEKTEEKKSAIDTEGYFGKPEFYDYSEVELPENYSYNEELLNEFNDLAAKYNLSQKSANELMSMAVKLTKLAGDNFSQAMAEQTRQQHENYKQMLNTDREIGGARLLNTINTANIAYAEFADSEVQKILTETGLYCHPKIVKMFYKIGKRMQNDSVHGVNSPAILKESREDILFPTM